MMFSVVGKCALRLFGDLSHLQHPPFELRCTVSFEQVYTITYDFASLLYPLTFIFYQSQWPGS